MVEAWVPAGYNVILPLYPGQGREPGECANEDSEVYDDLSICVNGTRVDGLPLSQQGYIDFVQKVNKIVKQEKEIRNIDKVFAAGLSLGGAAASFAVSSSGGGLYDASLLMNSFFGFTSPDADRVFNECIQNQSSSLQCITLLLTSQRIDELGDDVGIAPQGFQEFVNETLREYLPDDYSYVSYAIANTKIRSIITDLAENYDSLGDTAKDLLDGATLSWGDQCIKQRERGRGGICSFRLRNLFAAHSFAEYARQLTGTSRSAQAPVQFVTVERDSSTRNSLILQAARNQIRVSDNENDISLCFHRIVPNCELEGTGNECGVPHSMLSRPESEVVPPFELYWEEDIQGNSTHYFQKGIPMGVNTDIFSPFTVRDDCVQIDPTTEQDPSLFLPVFRGIWIRTELETDPSLELDSTPGNLNDSDRDSAAQLISAALNLPPGYVILVSSNVVSAGNDLGDDGPFQELYFEFPAELVSEQDLKNLEELVANDGYLDNALGTTVLELEVAGRHPVDAEDKSAHKKKKRKNGSKMSTLKKSKKTSKSKGKSRRLLY
jgi:hypothetical protein